MDGWTDVEENVQIFRLTPLVINIDNREALIDASIQEPSAKIV